ncbi:hypothetical protein ATO12_11050 [Aquimarina atlantica]|uniref:Uncharacterized protein n=1 Tax=Aquimarina atlantica TaxID=1317122 RepID=A0A023BMK3_9FLAO|nr:hypothetical protein [Aquimarina atlantica]EZH71292.1 hypothetical protein ATO12_11050 [Aquimarina atlantica]
MKTSFKILIAIIIIFLIGFLIINSFSGWYGYEKWKYRRYTYGDIISSKKRGVFVKDLEYSIELDSINYSFDLNVFVEKGFSYGKHSSQETIVLNETDHPYQISLPIRDTTQQISFNVHMNDTINTYKDNGVILLKKPFIKDTLTVDLSKFDNSSRKWNSIGKIKIWDESSKL